MNKFNGTLPIDCIKCVLYDLNAAKKEVNSLLSRKAEFEDPDTRRRYSYNKIEEELQHIEHRIQEIYAELPKKS